MYANSDLRRPSSTNRALASLGVHPCRLAIRLRRFPLSAGRRMLMTTGRVVFIEARFLQRNYCKDCSTSSALPFLFLVNDPHSNLLQMVHSGVSDAPGNGFNSNEIACRKLSW